MQIGTNSNDVAWEFTADGAEAVWGDWSVVRER